MDVRESYYTTPEEVLNSDRFYNYPQPKEHSYPYEPRKEPSNPVLRGLVVKLSAAILPRIPGLAGSFYKNAGWPKLKDVKGINGVGATYDPTVIPVRKEHDEDPRVYTDLKNLPEGKAMGEGSFYSILDYHRDYKAGKSTPNAVIEALLPLILRTVPNPSIHSKAWLDTNVSLVKKAAQASTQRWREGNQLGVLDGIPIGVKDEADLQGYYKKSMGSTMNTTNTLDETSWCVKKWEEQGAIVLGKLSMHEIGMDTSNNNPWHGTPINPYNAKYFPGGSSGGSASAVGAGIIPFALGCDGGGSIRIPSAWCGIYGLKTTHGWVSTRPYQTPAKSTSVAGPMAANMVDLEVAWRVMAQPDPEDALSRQFPHPIKENVTYPKRIGIYKHWFDRADPSVKATCQRAMDYYTTKLGYEIIDITIPHIHEAQLAHALTILNEATSTMTDPEIHSITAPNKILITVGRQASARDFLAAQRLRTIVMEHLAHLFKTHPGLIIVTPTTPNAGWPINPADLKYGASNGNQSIRNMEYVWLANFTGCPSISLPVGYVKAEAREGNVPVGLSGTGEWGSEDMLIEFGYEGEGFLREGVEGGRKRGEGWVDVMKLLPKGEKGIRFVQ
ncbi:glutamyl-tRNA amidotransferas-like protein subunit A [Tothia fuscella]|uniref:Glutamyl-tRNA amidotransferas-like protein subunit A n=1 Tax=Tothia fuscella TaxID=1048955 RepID=A0A9P4P5K7_9PEZI|nr:glutamyl-tRNA amidotransferas-like protein subunit A [Tothia fuscella]